MRGYIINKSKRIYSIGKRVGDTSIAVAGWAGIVAMVYASVFIYHMRQDKVGTKRTMGK